MYWLLERKNQKIIVDPGFYKEDSVKVYARHRFKRPDKVLEEIDLSPSDISGVLLTHYHESAIEAVLLYPKARVYMQTGAYFHARRAVDLGRAKKNLIDKESIEFLEEKHDKGETFTQ